MKRSRSPAIRAGHGVQPRRRAGPPLLASGDPGDLLSPHPWLPRAPWATRVPTAAFPEAHCKVSPLQPLGSSGPLPARSLSSERPPRVSAAPRRPGAGTLRLDKAEPPPLGSISCHMHVSVRACEHECV